MKIQLINTNKPDKYTDILKELYDYDYQGRSVTEIENNMILPDQWNIGIIVGESGSGKSTLLKTFGNLSVPSFKGSRPLVSEYDNLEPTQVCDLLIAVGLGSIPTWCKSYDVLSNGEKFRAEMARVLSENHSVYCLDEFSSNIDRITAQTTSNLISKYVKRNNKKIVVATCHRDIIDWLQPEWIYDTDRKEMLARGSLQRPKLQLEIFRCKYEAWELFKQHHYLDQNLNKSSRCYLIYANGEPCAFLGILAFPNGAFKNGWRESRLVVLPKYQGIGIGNKLSEYFGSMIIHNGGSYYSRTRHPKMIDHRSKSNNWTPVGSDKYTTITGKNRSKHGYNWQLDKRSCKSFKYSGSLSSIEESKLFYDNN